MPIGTIETINLMLRKLVYGRADGMPNSLPSVIDRSRAKTTTKTVPRCQPSASVFLL